MTTELGVAETTLPVRSSSGVVAFAAVVDGCIDGSSGLAVGFGA